MAARLAGAPDSDNVPAPSGVASTGAGRATQAAMGDVMSITWHKSFGRLSTDYIASDGDFSLCVEMVEGGGYQGQIRQYKCENGYGLSRVVGYVFCGCAQDAQAILEGKLKKLKDYQVIDAVNR